MRKYIKKQVLELIISLAEAQKQLETIDISDGKFADMLADLQEVAVVIGNQIDETEGEDTKAVTLLEEYCEVLWKLSQATDAHELNQDLAIGYRLLSNISEEVKQFNEQTDIVFLPYKASMWDCMETVWRAACEDVDCNVYVIPIPYYDRNQDGSFGEMHYEAEQLPDYVPVTSYQEYVLSQRHPEVVYIHNPFDEYNHVTSVHPDFYGSKLQKETDMLVYIPYFLMGEKLAETHSLLPAYVYADKIVLGNDKMMDDIDESIPREKFLITGCPKQERMVWLATHKEELGIPAEWKAKIQNKKVVFYNVSISGLLKDKEAMLDKMEEVFAVFEKRADLVLLYRPHPLAESTMSSMCPELLPRYRRLVNQVKQMKNAIYDTTADIGVSVAISDAYIGEYTSSVVDMFKSLQRPVFYLKKEQYYQPTLDEMLSDITYDVCMVHDELWFITGRTQILCTYNLKTEELKCVAEIPDAVSSDYIKIVNCEEKLILVPNTANAVCVYDMKTGTFRKDYFRDENVVSKFRIGAEVYDHYVFMMSAQYPAIVRYDVWTGEFAYFEECIKEICARMNHEEERLALTFGIAWEETLYLLSGRSNHILCFNMRTAEYEIHSVGQETTRFAGMAIDDPYCWIGKYQSCAVLRWNRLTGEVIEFSGEPNGYEHGDFPYCGLCLGEDMLYLPSCQANYSLQLSKTTGKLMLADFNMPYQENEFKSEYYDRYNGNHHVFAKGISTNAIAMCALYDDSLVILNTDDKSCKKIPIRTGQLKTEAKKYTGNMKEIWEKAYMPLNRYLEYLAKDLLGSNIPTAIFEKKLEVEGCPGKTIHKEVKNALKP